MLLQCTVFQFISGEKNYLQNKNRPQILHEVVVEWLLVTIRWGRCFLSNFICTLIVRLRSGLWLDHLIHPAVDFETIVLLITQIGRHLSNRLSQIWLRLFFYPVAATNPDHHLNDGVSMFVTKIINAENVCELRGRNHR